MELVEYAILTQRSASALNVYKYGFGVHIKPLITHYPETVHDVIKTYYFEVLIKCYCCSNFSQRPDSISEEPWPVNSFKLRLTVHCKKTTKLCDLK